MKAKLKTFEVLVLLLAIGSSLFSDIFYTKAGDSVFTGFFILSIPLLFAWFFLHKKFILNKNLLPIYGFIFILFIYSLLGVLKFSKITLFAQIIPFVITPILFMHIGYFGRRKSVVNIVLMVAVICALFSISQFLYNSYGLSGPASVFASVSEMMTLKQMEIAPESIFGRASGIFVSPNSLGLFGGMLFWLFLYNKHGLSPWKINLGIVLALFCLFYSFSRTSIVGILVSFFLCKLLSLVFVKSSVKSVGLLILNVALACYALSFLLQFITSYQLDRLNEIFLVSQSGVAQSNNLSGRVGAWSAIFEALKNMPFGTIVPPQLIINESPDNQYIYFFAQGGVLLLLAAIYFYIHFTWVALASGKKNDFTFLGMVVFLIIGSLTLVAFNSFVMSLFWLVVGMYMRDYGYTSSTQDRQIRRSLKEVH